MSCQRISVVLLLLCYLHISLSDSEVDLRTLLESGGTPQQETWTGTWFPHSTTVKPYQHNPKDSRVPMGVLNPDCDDAQSRLEVDWDGGPFEYTCYEAQKFVPQNIQPILSLDNIPEEYAAPHSCMNETIPYDGIPTFGTHRPLWPRWGEYLYVPPQRWLHNLEHGGVVMLYHPCSDPVQRNRLRDLVKGCMYRYVITPSKLTSPERPLALVTWGKLLTLSMVEPRIVKDFIKSHALKGPEKTSRDGQYNYHLKLPSAVVPGSDINDSELCPDLKRP